MPSFRLQPDKRLKFLQGFLRNPNLVGSVIPSSRFLERRLMEIANMSSAKLVVELGPGTGGTSRAILRTLPKDARLLAIELNPKFAKLLQSEPDPRLAVHYGSAENINDILVQHDLGKPDVVLSGMPFSTIPKTIGEHIIRQVWESLAIDGHFVAYQFRERVAVLGRGILGDPEVEVELLNVPPMRVYRWTKSINGNGRGIKAGRNRDNG